MREGRGEIRVGDQRLETSWHGPGPEEAPSLVFLHEGLGCVDLWRDFPMRLADALGFGALVYSRAGYGRSSPCALPRPIEYMQHEGLEILPRVLEATGIVDCVLIGHSDGGSIALVYAGGTEARPLRGLVTEAAHVFNEEICVRSIEAIRERYERGDLRERLARYHGANTECAFRGWCDAWLDPRFRAWNLESFLPGIDVPWLVIQGGDDDYGTLAQVDAIVAGSGGPTERFVPDGCRHAPHQDRPELLLEEMQRFIAGLSPR